jgi:hypothetical protein
MVCTVCTRRAKLIAIHDSSAPSAAPMRGATEQRLRETTERRGNVLDHQEARADSARLHLRTGGRRRRAGLLHHVRLGHRERDGRLELGRDPARDGVLQSVSGTSSPVSFTVDNPSSGSQRVGTITLSSITVDVGHSTCSTTISGGNPDFAMPAVGRQQSLRGRQRPERDPDGDPDDERNRGQPGRLPGRDGDAAPDQQLVCGSGGTQRGTERPQGSDRADRRRRLLRGRRLRRDPASAWVRGAGSQSAIRAFA